MFRSQSGPGGLSINTASANALPQSSAPQSSGSVLSKPPFANAVGTSQPQSATSLFSNTQTQSTGGQSTGASLFGTQTNSNPSTGGGLFGWQQPQQKPNNILGFGSVAQQQQPPQQQSTPGLFGSILGQHPQQQQQQQQQQSSGSFLGNSSFGFSKPPVLQNSTQLQQPAAPPPQPSMFSATIGQLSQQQQAVPGVRININELRPTTRFNDLHEDLQRTVEYVDNFILNKIQWQEECATSGETIDDVIYQIPPDVEFCSKQLDTMQYALENDAESIALAKKLVKTDAANAKLSFRAVHSLKAPQHVQQSGIWSTNPAPLPPMSEGVESDLEGNAGRNIIDYFSKQAEFMGRVLEDCKQNITEIEQYLGGIESSIAQQSQHVSLARGLNDVEQTAENQVKELASVLRAFENGILGVATKVGAARETVQDVMLGPGGSSQPPPPSRRFGA